MLSGTTHMTAAGKTYSSQLSFTRKDITLTEMSIDKVDRLNDCIKTYDDEKSTRKFACCIGIIMKSGGGHYITFVFEPRVDALPAKCNWYDTGIPGPEIKSSSGEFSFEFKDVLNVAIRRWTCHVRHFAQ